jgi:protoheme ferro-lyase
MMTISSSISWFLFFALAFFAGTAFHFYLVQPALKMTAWLAGMLLAIFGLLVLAYFSFSGWDLVTAGLGFYCFFLLGYLLANRTFLQPRRQPGSRVLQRAARDAGDGHLALVVVAQGEPQAYDPGPWLDAFYEFDRDNVPYVPRPLRPFFLARRRREYLERGGSFHNKVQQRIFEKLKKAVQPDLPAGTRSYLAFLDVDPRLQAVLVRALNKGASAVLLAPVCLAESTLTRKVWKSAQSVLPAVDPPAPGVRLGMAAPLWDARPLVELFLRRAEGVRLGCERSKLGFVLVGQGQPLEWDHKFPAQVDQETHFRQEVARRLIEAGYPRSNILLAWSEFKEPKVVSALEKLASRRLEKILVFPVFESADSLASEVHLLRQAAQAHLPSSLQVIHMGAWGEDDLVIEALRQKILEAYEKMIPEHLADHGVPEEIA